MRILLDTHVLLWTLQDSKELSDKARYIIEDEDNEIIYSIASLWEIQIKHLNHPNEMKLNAETLEQYCDDSEFYCCPIRKEHVYYLSELKAPSGVKHKDPFDKIMICQAVTEGMLFLTKDSQILQYNEPCILQV